jgi:hypothetical protein
LRKGVNAQRLDAFIASVGRRSFMVPLWFEQLRLENGIFQEAVVPRAPRTIAQVNFNSWPVVDLIPSNLIDDGNGVFQILTDDALSGSAGYAWMRTAEGGPATMQTESAAINTSASNGWEASEVLDIDAVTFEIFAKVGAGGSGVWNLFFQGAVVDSGGDSIDFYFETGLNFSNQPYVDAYYYDTENTYTPNDSDTGFTSFVFPRDVWTHIAIVMDGLNFRCYVAGQLVRSFSASSGPVFGMRRHSFQYFWMGTNYGAPSNAPNVYIDSARAHSGALYSGASFTPPTAAF